MKQDQKRRHRLHITGFAVALILACNLLSVTSVQAAVSGSYDLVFSQISLGAGSAISDSIRYKAEFNINAQGTEALSQTSDSGKYDVVNVIGEEAVLTPVTLSGFTID